MPIFRSSHFLAFLCRVREFPFIKGAFIHFLTPDPRGRDSIISTATRYGLGDRGIASRWEARFSAPVQTGPGAKPASYTMAGGHSRG